MRIVVIDDKREERERAKAAVEAAGHEAIVLADTSYDSNAFDEIAEADGVITDLFFNPRRSNDEVERSYNSNPPPMGLMVALHCLHLGKPVVICTEGNHHGVELSFVFDAYVSANSYQIGFGWEERKDWATAVKMVEKGAKSAWDLQED